MKHLFNLFTLVLVVGLALSTTAWGQLLLDENFDYPAGDSLNVLHGWVVQPTASYVNTIKVVSPGLTYSGYISALGNAAKVDTTGQDLYKTFTSQTSGSVYASCLVNFTKTTTTGDYFFHFTESAGSTNFRARLFVKRDASDNVAFGLQFGSTASSVYTGFSYAMNTTYLVVIKYKFVGGTLNDTTFLFVNPTLAGNEPSPTLTASNSADTDFSGVAAVNLRQGAAANAPRLSLDGIRVATSWADAPLPIQLASFVGYFVNSNDVTFEWETISEVNNLGFWIQKRNPITNVYTTIEESFQQAAQVPSTYKWTYNNAVIENTEFYLLQQDNDGLESRFGPIMLNPTNVPVEAVPSVFALNQNYPNPFNPSTVINYQLATDNYTTLKVYNIIGKEVATLVNGYQTAGYHQVTFDGSQLSNGIYFYKLQSGNNVEVKKLTLVK
ncbi:MAG: T9SS type A sorting domain-containing protein [Bacteroidota bacterium]|nr:T9SS type A sorting domain-containing protein [Bacteroidota bacterium]